MQHAAPTRRSVLAGAVTAVAATVGVAGCSGDGQPAPPPRRDADQRLRDAVVVDVTALAARYAATRARHPALARELGPLAAEHASHLTALADVVAPSPTAPTGSPRGTPSTSAAPPAVPFRPTAARLALAAAESDAAARRLAETGRASAVALVRLLASMGACEAGHGVLLSEGAGTGE